MVTDLETTVRFEGIGVGTEIWGGTQANFVLARAGSHAKESAVLLNGPAAAYLAQETGESDTPGFRARAAELIGRLWIERALAAGQHIDSLVVLARQSVVDSPAFVDALRADAAAAASAAHADEHTHA